VPEEHVHVRAVLLRSVLVLEQVDVPVPTSVTTVTRDNHKDCWVECERNGGGESVKRMPAQQFELLLLAEDKSRGSGWCIACDF
jgi:hypothetical protein